MWGALSAAKWSCPACAALEIELIMSDLMYWEDLPEEGYEVHDVIYTVSKEEILDIARRYDPLPFHLDEEAAKKSIYGGLTAPGVLTQCINVWLIAHSLPRAAVIGLVGKDEVVFPNPVRPGDRLHLEREALGKRRSRSKPDRGLNRTRFIVKNQNDEIVYSAIHTGMFFTRDAAPELVEAGAPPDLRP